MKRTGGSGGFMSTMKHTRQTLRRLVAAVWVTAATYIWLAPLAYLERGYEAYGGECLVAVLAGVVTYYLMGRE